MNRLLFALVLVFALGCADEKKPETPATFPEADVPPASKKQKTGGMSQLPAPPAAAAARLS